MSATHPKLRPVETHWVDSNGQPGIVLRDRLGLSDRALFVPRVLGLLLSLCDGTRDEGALATAFELRTGLRLPNGVVHNLLAQLDEALLLDNERYAEAKAAGLRDYRAAPFRLPASAGRAYSADPSDLACELESYLDGVAQIESCAVAPLRGLICPHIDYHRGGSVYAKAWRYALPWIEDVELVIMFGTDHIGDSAALTLTRQSYATPFGVIPTATDVVDAVAEAVGHEAAFASELHHKHEHSVELGAVWLHYFFRDRPLQLVPILCGSFHLFTEGLADPAPDERLAAAISSLRAAASNRKTLVVAAADLAHVGPAFGDPYPFGATERSSLASADSQLLDDLCTGGAEPFFNRVKAEGDRRRVCGLPPIYLALRVLGNLGGQVIDYAQCPADAAGDSWVSIAGVALH